MLRALAIIALASCCSAPPKIVERVVEHTRTVHDTKPCLSVKPPPAPEVLHDGNWDELPAIHGTVIDCSTLSPDECQDWTTAVWAEYGHELRLWTHFYAWPQCAAGEVPP